MTSSPSKFYMVFMFLCLIIILLIFIYEVEAKQYCKELSQTWKGGICLFSHKECNSVCVNSEHAKFGACLFPVCLCVYNCTEYFHPT
ncbi:unnamed protein product [Trifolium pratense]|uniref:Uncharacterized protein n=1 Tax=Trifolium pratense TaxID=57577 RepID=A0ACB0IRF4_TRIPR|nr:unnamed protein product [Trifolium pratense]